MILFNYTTRSRPANFFRGLRSIENNCTTPYKVLVSIDEDDYTMNNEDVKRMLLNFKNIVLCIGTSKNKIDAINRDMDLVEQWWDVLVNVSDDQVFIKKDFDFVPDFILIDYANIATIKRLVEENKHIQISIWIKFLAKARTSTGEPGK